MTIQYSVTHQSNNVEDIATQLGATGWIQFYTGLPPAHCSTNASGTFLASLALANPAGTTVAGVFTLGTVTGGTAGTGGSVGYFRLSTNSAGTGLTAIVAQGTVSTTGADINFAGGIAWTQGEAIGITSLTITANGA